MSRLNIEVTKMRWIRKPLVQTFTVDLDNDFGGKLWIGRKMGVDVKVTHAEYIN